jgi:hypothetical protein
MTTAAPKLPSPPPEIPRVSALSGCAPLFRAAIMRVLAAVRAAGFDPVVYESLRSGERQRYLYGFGRQYDEPGDPRGRVTNSSDFDETWHGFGLAVDIISESLKWSAGEPFWRALGAAARDEGLVWGGDWPTFKDRPHVQWGAPMRQSPSPRAARLFDRGGFEAVWKEVGAS